MQEDGEELHDPYPNVISTSDTDQSKAVYIWEDKQFPDCYGSYLSIRHCQEFVNEIWADLKLSSAPPKVVDGRGAQYARAWDDKISLPKWSRNFTVMIHELSHCVTGLIDETDNGEHGPIYVHVYMTLMTRYCNHKYRELETQAKENGVKVQRIKLKARLKPFCMAEHNESVEYPCQDSEFGVDPSSIRN